MSKYQILSQTGISYPGAGEASMQQEVTKLLQ